MRITIPGRPEFRSTSRRNPVPGFPGIVIHHFPERLFTCSGFRKIGGYVTAFNGIADGSSSSADPTTSVATGLWPGYTYNITVTAYSLNGTTGALSTTSAPFSVMTAAATTTPNPDAPTAPTDLTGAGDGGGEAIISWNPSTSVNEAQSQIQYNIYINGVLDSFDSSVGVTQNVYIFPRGATVPAQVWVVAVDQFGNTSARGNVLTITGF